jgi:hypothetical protein
MAAQAIHQGTQPDQTLVSCIPERDLRAAGVLIQGEMRELEGGMGQRVGLEMGLADAEISPRFVCVGVDARASLR